MELRTATEADCEAAIPLLQRFENAAIPASRWRALFHYSWPEASGRRGFILHEGGRIIGFLATILFEREIEGRMESFVNLSSWITLPEARRGSILLLSAALKSDATIICTTPAAHVEPIYRKLGFSDLETHVTVVYPRLKPGSWLREFAARSTGDPLRSPSLLRPDTGAAVRHHQPHPGGQLLVESRGKACVVFFTRTMGMRAPYAYIQSISDPEFFRDHLAHFQARLLLAAGTPLIMIDTRLLQGITLPSSKTVELRRKPLFRSSRLKPAQIDNLYTENILLGL